MGDSRECNQMDGSDGMDDDSGLELSLGLSCGGFASKTKGKDALKEISPEQGVSDKIKNGITSGDTSVNVGLCGNNSEENNEVKQSNNPVPPAEENFWTNLGNTITNEHGDSVEMHMNQEAQFPGFREQWFAGEPSVQVQDMSANTEKAKVDQQQRQAFSQQQEGLEQNTKDIADQKWQEHRKKRKVASEDQRQQSFDDKEDDRDDALCKSTSVIQSQLKSSISVMTQDVSHINNNNEDTGDSEVEASSLRRTPSVVKYSTKLSMPAGSDASDKRDSQIPVTWTTASGNEANQERSGTAFASSVAMTSTSLPYSHQSFPAGHVPYSHSVQLPSNPSLSCQGGLSLPYMMQFMPPTVTGADRAAVRPVNSNSFQMPLGYAPFQLPTLETPSSWVHVSHSHQPPAFGSKTAGGARMSSDNADGEVRASQAAVQASQGVLGIRSETAPQDSQKPDLAKSLMKDERQLERTGSDMGGTSLPSMPVDDEPKHGVSWSRENANHHPMVDGHSQEFWNLRPGIAPGIKFGGSGNSPDLPWVSATGTGPNGKTISGVMYKYNRTQLKIVCACHGRHMSPSEFVQHANDVDVSNVDNNVVANSFPNGNHATSAQG